MENTKALSNMNKKELYDHCKYLQSKIDEVKPIIHNFMDANLLVKVADNLFAMPDFTTVKEENEKLKEENHKLQKINKLYEERCENLEEMSKTRNEMVMKYKSFVENVMEKSKQNQE
jgi:ABC-type cobalamin/Fe3+-siderophores transport system ATPase subunit